MLLVVQRCKSAEVYVSKKIISKINRGLVLLLGVEKKDSLKDVIFLANKVTSLRVFNDDHDKTNLSINDVKGSILVVSQFTLCADTTKGRRPSFVNSAKPVKAEKLYDNFILELKKRGIKCKSGTFGAYMELKLNNDGPFTLILNSK
ncbi:MAG: D-aminoacyl-tRNA deacylase [Candidatus Neomarinimicrobiota bacterium]|tara:strand:+ start:40 stop:480 length:441 start_codon:yes stop_codon:yes gene_type:complete